MLSVDNRSSEAHHSKVSSERLTSSNCWIRKADQRQRLDRKGSHRSNSFIGRTERKEHTAMLKGEIRYSCSLSPSEGERARVRGRLLSHSLDLIRRASRF